MAFSENSPIPIRRNKLLFKCKTVSCTAGSKLKIWQTDLTNSNAG